FGRIQELGGVADDEMARVFNLGIGMILVVAKPDLKKAERVLARLNETPYRIGVVKPARAPKPRVVYK
ncbi:MAG TPA: phosphoribosylformylglycinamidine cyclo-ligase, partial [Solibacterales bacterium]|nr:phosphoribosylformylglycinamidine cyclo-ligase [Bryobacterales bacterium]